MDSEDEVTATDAGINSTKTNEMQAALGILQLKDINENIRKRKEIADWYIRSLSNINGIRFLNIVEGVENYNYSYFPIFIDENYGKSRDELYHFLRENGIYGRRYFYPLVTQFPMFKRFVIPDHSTLKYG